MAWNNFRYIISLSGGIASAASAIIAAERGFDYEMVFADTLIEDEDLYRFIDELAAKLGKPYHHLKDGRDPWEVFVDESYIGNSRAAKCSQKLKTAQVKKWLKANASAADALVLGMYPDEFERLERAQANWSPRPVSSLLISYKVFADEAAAMVAKLGIRRPRLYDMGFPHNNCGGMCVRAGQGQFATLLERKPEFYRDQEQRQNRAMDAIGPTAKPFIRATLDGRLQYFTMQEFRELVEMGELTPKLYEMGGCGCFVDDVSEDAAPAVVKPDLAIVLPTRGARHAVLARFEGDDAWTQVECVHNIEVAIDMVENLASNDTMRFQFVKDAEGDSWGPTETPLEWPA